MEIINLVRQQLLSQKIEIQTTDVKLKVQKLKVDMIKNKQTKELQRLQFILQQQQNCLAKIQNEFKERQNRTPVVVKEEERKTVLETILEESQQDTQQCSHDSLEKNSNCSGSSSQITYTQPQKMTKKIKKYEKSGKGEEFFFCPHKDSGCKYKSLQKYNVKEHVKRKHAVEIIRCKECKYKTTYMYNLKRHVANCHSDYEF